MNKFQVKFPPQETYLSISQSKFNFGEIAVNAVKKKGETCWASLSFTSHYEILLDRTEPSRHDFC